MAKQKRVGKRPPVSPKGRAAVLLVSVLVLAVVGALALSAPAVKDALFSAVGILPKVEVPVLAGGDAFGPVSVHFIDVGQGDAVLIEADGEFALIDAGPPEGEDDLLAYMEAAGVQRLRYLVMTHPHADHIGSMRAVVQTFPVDLAVFPDFAKAPMPTNTLFLNLLKALDAQGIPTETAQEGAVYPLGSGTLTVLQNGIATADNLNLLSLVTLFEAGGLRYLSSGDGEAANEQALLAAGADVSANLFKAAHHGSSTSNTDVFLAAVRPSLVVVSSAAGNSYGHPHIEPMNTYQKYGAAVVNTAEVGNVRAGMDTSGALVYAVSGPGAGGAAA